MPVNSAMAQTLPTYSYSPWFEATGDNHVDIPDTPSLRLVTFSAAAWFKTSQNYPGNAMILNKGGLGSDSAGQNMNYGIWLNSAEKLVGGFERASDGVDITVISSALYNDGQWHYAVVTFDGFIVRLYVDGNQIGTKSGTSPETNVSHPLRIGANANPAGKDNYFVGQIDEVRVWNRAITASEVSNYLAQGTVSSSGMVVYYDGDLQSDAYNYSPWFDAAGENYVDVPDAANLRLTKFSAAAWFKTSADHWVNGFIVNKGGTGSETSGENMNYGIWFTSQEKLNAGFESSDATDYYITHSNTYNDGKWHHVAVTYDGAALRLYLDGTQLTWRPISGLPETSGTMPLRIGANSQGEMGYFKGQIDEVRVWNRAITASEVLNLYQMNTANTNGMLVYNDGDVPPPPPPPDTNAPTIIAPSDKLIASTGNLTSTSLGTPIVADEEDTLLSVTNNAPAGGFPIGTSTVIWTATDDAGNAAAATQRITVKAQSNPPVTYTFCNSGCDYSSLQTAVNSLPAGGGKILVKNGEYVMSSTITLKSGTIIEFANDASIYFRGDSKPIFKGTSVNNIKIIGGEIVAERNGVKAISFTSSNEITVTGTDLTLVQGSNSNAFYCVDCNGVYISNIHAKTASRLVDIKTSSGITDGKSANIWVQDSVFEDASIEGVKINKSKNVHIINNTVSETADNGIDIGWNQDSDVDGNTLFSTGNPNGAAIHTDSANGADITNNYVDITGWTAIPVYRASNINVGGNTVIHATNAGIDVITQLEPSSNVNIVSNHIISAETYGYYQSPGQNQIVIANNLIEQVPAGAEAIKIFWSNNETTRMFGNVVN